MWVQVMPDWERLTAHIEADAESKEKLGWVREMYAFSVALALQDIKVDLAKPPSNKLIAQPPADASLGQAAMFHYTWGTVFQNSSGAKVWEFDKRKYTDASIVTQVWCNAQLQFSPLTYCMLPLCMSLTLCAFRVIECSAIMYQSEFTAMSDADAFRTSSSILPCTALV